MKVKVEEEEEDLGAMLRRQRQVPTTTKAQPASSTLHAC
jgi:hypothetical protein